MADGREFGQDGSCPSPHRFRDIIGRINPEYMRLSREDNPYDNPRTGYNVPWTYLTREEQEYATVYMLGRLLWCIFEGMSAPQRGAIWSSYHNEPDFDFPEFRQTPLELRGLIGRCTAGRREQLSSRIVRKGSRIVLRDDPRGDGTAEQIRAVAREFWLNEVHWAETFVLGREDSMATETWDTNFFGRPTLLQVRDALDVYQTSITS